MTESNIRPLCVVDIELTGGGRHKNKHRIIAIGACIVHPHLIASSIREKSTIVLDPADISHGFKFSVYIKDEEALNEIKDIDDPGPIWQESKESLFWLRTTPSGRNMLQRTLSFMKNSVDDAKSAILKFENWLSSMLKLFPDLLLASDVSNSDFAWLDYYRLKYLDLESINFVKGGKFEAPIDLGSMYSGFMPKVQLQRAFETVCARNGFPIPRVKAFHDHTPLNDALQLGLQSMYLMVQFHKISQG